MATGDVKLLSVWASPFAMRAILALEAKGVTYELIEENLNEKSKLLLESNPVYKKVPVLLHNGKAISESLIIALYVDEAWPEDETRPGFFPKDPYGRAFSHFWSDFIDKKIFEETFRAMTAKAQDKEAALKTLYDNFITLESGFTKHAEKPFFNGDTIGFVDIALAPYVAWLPVFEDIIGVRLPSEKEAPHLHKFFSAIGEQRAAKAAFPDQEKLLAFGRTL